MKEPYLHLDSFKTIVANTVFNGGGIDGEKGAPGYKVGADENGLFQRSIIAQSSRGLDSGWVRKDVGGNPPLNPLLMPHLADILSGGEQDIGVGALVHMMHLVTTAEEADTDYYSEETYEVMRLSYSDMYTALVRAGISSPTHDSAKVMLHPAQDLINTHTARRLQNRSTIKKASKKAAR